MGGKEDIGVGKGEETLRAQDFGQRGKRSETGGEKKGKKRVCEKRTSSHKKPHFRFQGGQKV